MNVDEFVAVSGKAEIFRLASSRTNGLLLEDIDTGKTKFYPVRKHQFTPLGSVSIYTLEDTEPLKNIFIKMFEKGTEFPIPAPSSDKMVLLEYFENILPDYDEDKVYPSDIKKVIKWFTFLNDRGLIDAKDSATEEE